MKILVTTWRRWLPIKILTDEVKIGDILKIGKKYYYITKVGKLFAYCVRYRFKPVE